MFKHKKIAARKPADQNGFKTIRIKSSQLTMSLAIGVTGINLQNVIQGKKEEPIKELQFAIREDNKKGIEMNRDLNRQLSKSVCLNQNVSQFTQNRGYGMSSKNKENMMMNSTKNKYYSIKSHHSPQEQQQSMIQQVFEMLNEIKSQNAYLIERNAELEYTIERDLKPKIEGGFSELKSEMKILRKQLSSDVPTKAHKTKHVKSIPLGIRRKRFSSSRMNSNVYEQTINEVEELSQTVGMEPNETIFRSETQVTHQLAEGGESTFMRRLEQTSSDMAINQDMRVSIGANILQMMQLGNAQNRKQAKESKPKARGFNFRFNLDEIDKIIEEEDMPEKEVVPMQENNANRKDEMRQSFKKETSVQRREKTNQGQKRKMWVINPRKSLKGTRASSKERPKTAGMRLGRAPVTKLENEDPILALLRQESEQQMESSPLKEKQTPQLQSESIVQNKIEVQEEEKEAPMVLQKKTQPVKRIVKRGMFNAPPPNLIESLLLGDSNIEESVTSQIKDTPPSLKAQPSNSKRSSPSPTGAFRQNRFIKVNNFLVDRGEKSQSKSRSKIRLPNIDADEEDIDAQDENPFNSISTLIKNEIDLKDKSEDNQGEDRNKRFNLFFHGKQHPIKKGTANFGL